MMWYTHASIGANAIWLTLLIGPAHLYSPFLLMIASFASLLPDIDGKDAKIQHFRYIGKPLKAFGKASYHRGFFHSPLATVLIAIPCLFIEPYVQGFTIAFVGGYFSHIIIDAFNKTRGIPFLYPYKKADYYLLPKKWRSEPNEKPNIFLFWLGTIGMVTFLLLWREAAAEWFFNNWTETSGLL